MTSPTHTGPAPLREATQNSQLGENKHGHCFKMLGLNVIIYTAIDNQLEVELVSEDEAL